MIDGKHHLFRQPKTRLEKSWPHLASGPARKAGSFREGLNFKTLRVVLQWDACRATLAAELRGPGAAPTGISSAFNRRSSELQRRRGVEHGLCARGAAFEGGGGEPSALHAPWLRATEGRLQAKSLVTLTAWQLQSWDLAAWLRPSGGPEIMSAHGACYVAASWSKKLCCCGLDRSVLVTATKALESWCFS